MRRVKNKKQNINDDNCYLSYREDKTFSDKILKMNFQKRDLDLRLTKTHVI